MRQEGSAYNGHFARTCYHPLFYFNRLGLSTKALDSPKVSGEPSESPKTGGNVWRKTTGSLYDGWHGPAA
jgi:hypothetical protein